MIADTMRSSSASISNTTTTWTHFSAETLLRKGAEMENYYIKPCLGATKNNLLATIHIYSWPDSRFYTSEPYPTISSFYFSSLLATSELN
jgi:hypothetical protein